MHATSDRSNDMILHHGPMIPTGITNNDTELLVRIPSVYIFISYASLLRR